MSQTKANSETALTQPLDEFLNSPYLIMGTRIRRRPRVQKRMLEVRQPSLYLPNPKKEVFINFSSLDVIQTCKRKAQYLLKERMIRDADESTALTFGSSIHAALAYFYSHSSTDRRLEDFIRTFTQTAQKLVSLEKSDKRSIANGTKILNHYYETYKLDPWVIYEDEDGKFIERSFEVPYFSHRDFNVTAFGTIDAIFQNTDTGEICVVDHKTTSSMGATFYDTIKPRAQFALYTEVAGLMGVPTNQFMMNGIGVMKTKQEVGRVFTTFDKADYEETRDAMERAIIEFLACEESKKFPMNTYACHQYGGCQFREICSTPAHLRANVIQSLYGPDKGVTCG